MCLRQSGAWWASLLLGPPNLWEHVGLLGTYQAQWRRGEIYQKYLQDKDKRDGRNPVSVPGCLDVWIPCRSHLERRDLIRPAPGGPLSWEPAPRASLEFQSENTRDKLSKLFLNLFPPNPDDHPLWPVAFLLRSYFSTVTQHNVVKNKISCISCIFFISFVWVFEVNMFSIFQ